MKHPFLNKAVYHPNTMTAGFKCFYEASRVWNHQQIPYTLTSNMDTPKKTPNNCKNPHGKSQRRSSDFLNEKQVFPTKKTAKSGQRLKTFRWKWAHHVVESSRGGLCGENLVPNMVVSNLWVNINWFKITLLLGEDSKKINSQGFHQSYNQKLTTIVTNYHKPQSLLI